MSDRVNVAVVGATGAVGETMLAILHERAFPPVRSRRSRVRDRPDPACGSETAAWLSRTSRPSISATSISASFRQVVKCRRSMRRGQPRRVAWSSIIPRSSAMTTTSHWWSPRSTPTRSPSFARAISLRIRTARPFRWSSRSNRFTTQPESPVSTSVLSGGLRHRQGGDRRVGRADGGAIERAGSHRRRLPKADSVQLLAAHRTPFRKTPIPRKK